MCTSDKSLADAKAVFAVAHETLTMEHDGRGLLFLAETFDVETSEENLFSDKEVEEKLNLTKDGRLYKKIAIVL